MYKGTNKTALTSQRHIASALLSMLEEEPFDDIRISSICQRANCSRQTFYSLFQSKENVIAYLVHRDCKFLTDTGEDKAQALRFLCRSLAEYAFSNTAILQLLADNNLTHLLHAEFYDSILHSSSLVSQLRADVRPFAADYLASCFTSIIRTYLREGQSIDPKLLEETTYSLLQGNLFKD